MRSLIAGLCLLFSGVSATDGMDSTIVAAQMRCQGYLCPQWAFDVTRYDPLRKLNQTFEYVLAELLPLAPTVDRDFNMLTAYDPASRTYTAVACDYPFPGMDSFWTMKVAGDITSVTPILTNIIVPHPDTGVNQPGTMVLQRVLAAPDGGVRGLFTNGDLTKIDVAGQKHVSFASLASAGVEGFQNTDAQKVVGNTLNSFIMDAKGNSFLVKTDLTTGAVGKPLLIQRIQGQLGQAVPIAAHMVKMDSASEEQLMLVSAGNFDTFTFVNETTGEQNWRQGTSNLAEAIATAVFMCNPDLKDCDFWNTQAVDLNDGTIYFQAHDETDDIANCEIYKVQWYPSLATGTPYPIFATAEGFMSFGFAGYQGVAFE